MAMKKCKGGELSSFNPTLSNVNIQQDGALLFPPPALKYGGNSCRASLPDSGLTQVVITEDKMCLLSPQQLLMRSTTFTGPVLGRSISIDFLT